MGVPQGWLCGKENRNPNHSDLAAVRVLGWLTLLFLKNPDLQQLLKARKQQEAASFLYAPFIFHPKIVCLSRLFL